MSFSKNKSSSNQTQTGQNTATTSLDPTYSNLVYGNYQNAKNTLSPTYTPYTGEMVAGFTPAQLQAQGLMGDIASNNVGQDALNNAISTTQGLTSYNPTQVQSNGYAPMASTAASAGPAAQAQAASIDRSNIGNVSDIGLGGVDLSQYMNPFTQAVTDTTLGNLAQQNDIIQNQNRARAAASHSFGGASAALQQAQTDKDYLNQVATTAAGLNSQNYTNAQTAAQADLARQLAAQQSNQAADLSVAGTNAGNAQQAALANQAATNSQSQYNAGNQQATNLANQAATNSASQYNSGQDLQAKLANQQAAAAAAAQRQAAAGQLADLSGQQLSEAADRAGLLGQAGDQQQAQQQAIDTANLDQYQNAQNWPLIIQQLLNQTVGTVPQTGTTTQNSSGSASGTSTSTKSGFDLSSLFAPIKLPGLS